VFSEIISIGGKNWEIGGKKYIGEWSGGRIRPPADQSSKLAQDRQPMACKNHFGPVDFGEFCNTV